MLKLATLKLMALALYHQPMDATEVYNDSIDGEIQDDRLCMLQSFTTVKSPSAVRTRVDSVHDDPGRSLGIAAATLPATVHTGWLKLFRTAVLDVTPVRHKGWTKPFIFVGLFALLGLTCCCCCCKTQSKNVPRTDTEGDAFSDVEELEHADLDEDTYGLTIACLVRDTQKLAREHGTKHPAMRKVRLFSSILLLFINITLQVFLIYEVKTFGTAKSVHDIRIAYEEFEIHMYDHHTWQTTTGKARGIKGYFDRSRFNSMPDKVKEEACKIPFSQPAFLSVVLLLWTLTALGEIKTCWNLFSRLIVQSQTATSMEFATEEDRSGNVVIYRLTPAVKGCIFGCVVVPRAIVSLILLWLGCRWLTATNDFADLILNAVALEFILLLKDLLYHTLVSDRNKRETQTTKVDFAYESSHPTMGTFLGALAWGLLGVLWVYLYIYHFQQVLPDYQWDVREVCESWIKDEYSV